jgi:hypothetical protein
MDMEEIDKFIYTNELLALYGKLLTPKQFEVMRLYYNLDYSLQEISENLSISRAAVSDTLKKALGHLEEFERHLALHQRIKTLNQLVDELSEQNLNDNAKKIIEKIKEEL